MTGRTGGTSRCRWCRSPALPRAGSAQVCPRCQDRVDRVVREALGRQRRLRLSNVVMAREFGVSLDTWRRIRISVEKDPGVHVATARIDPRHREQPGDDPTDVPSRWEHRAACAGSSSPDMFFPETAGDRARIAEVTVVCDSCPVTRECRVHRGREGVWGGKLYTLA